MPSEFHQQFHKNSRIEAFSDGVFSIVLTLLVLDLRTPKLEFPNSSAELWQDLFTMRSQIFSFLLSFLFVIMLWVAHNIWFRTLERTDSVVLWVNNFFLLLVCFIPFPTSLIGSYPGNSVAMIVFGTDWILIAIVMFLVGKYCYQKGFVSKSVDLVRYGEALRIMGYILPFSVIPLLIAWWNPMVALWIYVCQVLVGIIISFRIRLAQNED